MSKLWHLFLVFAVLLCGSQLAEPAEAKTHFDHAGQCAAGGAEDGGETGKRAADHPEAGHHHCPVAPGPSHAAAGAEIVPGDAVTHASRVVTLHSLSRAPPHDPPTA